MGTIRQCDGLLCILVLLMCSSAAFGHFLETINCTQSSMAFDGHCGRALDGVTNRNYNRKSCTHTRQQSSPWWQATLKAKSRVKSVRIYNRGDCCANRLNNFVIKVDGVVCAAHQSTKAFDVKKFSCNRDGRVVRIESRQPGKSILTLCEVQLIGWQVLLPASCKNNDKELLKKLKAAKLDLKRGIRNARGAFQAVVNSIAQQKVKSMPINRTCQNGVATFSCPEGYTVRILRAVYGRQSTRYCPKGPLSTVTTCAARNSKAIVDSRCHGKKSCQVPVVNSVFSNPCAGTYKYLEVEYRCELTSIMGVNRLTEARSRYHASKRLLKHRYNTEKITLKAKLITSKRLYRECLSKTSCQSDRRVTLQGAIDKEQKNYANAVANARRINAAELADVSKRRVINKPTTLTCENQALLLSCPTGYAIQILSAFFGRRDAKTCPHKQIKTTSCSAGTAQHRVAVECSGKHNCRIQASNSVFGDPCAGTYKYMEVKYSCDMTAAALKAAQNDISSRFRAAIALLSRQHLAIEESQKIQLKAETDRYNACVKKRRQARSFNKQLVRSTQRLKQRLANLRTRLRKQADLAKKDRVKCDKERRIERQIAKQSLELIKQQGKKARQNKIYKKNKKTSA